MPNETKIYLLTKSKEYDNYYIVETFKTREEVLKYIEKSSYYINDFRFIEGKELKLTFEIEECE